MNANSTLIDGIFAAGGPKIGVLIMEMLILRINRDGSAFRKKYMIDLSQNYSEKNNPVLNNGDSVWIEKQLCQGN